MDPRIERTILTITSEFRRPLSLRTLAKEVGLSPFHFHRLFTADTKETPANYLARVRLEYAAHLLVMMPDAPLLAIAIESGFPSASSFARAFRLRFGQSATDYRAANPLPCDDSKYAKTLDLRLLPDQLLGVQRCELDNGALTTAYQNLARVDASNPVVAFGIFVDMPFHQARHLCRHYVGLDKDLHKDAKDGFILPGGVYVVIPLQGGLDEASQTILTFHAEQIAPSRYAVASTLAFERIVLPNSLRDFDYVTSTRELFIKVRRKNEPVI